ncbi:hypothetical protein RMATCC62417_02364 [Rhizopus microsporus]|nr:hypothetical protein RMATCC62417_02364 [Rhizopus microsporus]
MPKRTRKTNEGTVKDPIDLSEESTTTTTTKRLRRTKKIASSNTVSTNTTASTSTGKRRKRQVASFVLDENAMQALKTSVEAEKKKRLAIRTKLPPEAKIYLNESMRGRVTRALKQRMFVLSRQLSPDDESIEVFEVLGSIGNNYTVTISSHMKCTCMDYALRRTHCKHILMILLKVYRLPYDNPLYQSLHTKKEERIHARSFCRQVDPSVLVPEDIRERIMKTMYGVSQNGSTPEAKRRPLDTSDCPICFEEFEEDKIDQIDFCKVCGNNIHKECFGMWAASKGANATCVYCRSKWVTPESSTGPKKKTGVDLGPGHLLEGNYANFAKELGLATKRDTSTYRRSYRDEDYLDDDYE